MQNGHSVAHLSDDFDRARVNRREMKYANVDARYKAAKQTRFDSRTGGLGQTPQSADHHYAAELDYFRMVEIARMLDRDDVLAGAAVNRLVANVLQCGFTYDPKTGDASTDELLKVLWEQYSNEPSEVDYQQEKTLHELAQITLREMIVAGDTFILPTNRGSLQLIENHRVRTPIDLDKTLANMTIHGVRLNEDRIRQSYYFTRDDISLVEFPYRRDVVEVSARNEEGIEQVYHLYHPKRISQTRGVTKFAPITDTCTMHDDIQFAKLVQQQGVSVWTMVRERGLGFELPPGVREPITLQEDPNRPGETRPMRNVSAGMVYTTYPGETVKGFSPNVPSPTFFDHARQIQQLIAINLDLPLILLLLDASDTNFSGWRGAMEQAKLSFRAFQKWFSQKFYTRILRWKLRQWSDPSSPLADPMITSMRSRGVNVFAHEWIAPSWPHIQPLEDASADLLEARNSLTSMRRAQNKRGADWDVVSNEIVEDNAKLIRKAAMTAKQLSGEIGEEVKWREVAQLPIPEGVSISTNVAELDMSPEQSANEPNEVSSEE